MDDTGKQINLSLPEMIGCNPVVDLKNSEQFMKRVASTPNEGSETIKVTGWGGALTSGTLGNFTINYNGALHVDAGRAWSFLGTMNFFDYWDFDPKPFDSKSNRPTSAEIKVRVAAAALPGRPFYITSVDTPVSQTSADTRATWAGGAPSKSTGSLVRTGADIESGAVAGGEVGGEAGAQSSEDLNK